MVRGQRAVACVTVPARPKIKMMIIMMIIMMMMMTCMCHHASKVMRGMRMELKDNPVALNLDLGTSPPVRYQIVKKVHHYSFCINMTGFIAILSCTLAS